MASMQMYALAGRVQDNFINTEVSANGVYAIKFWPLGVPVHILVDDYIPWTTNNSNPRFGRYPRHEGGNVSWPIYMEKAFAKLHGSYGRTAGGWSTNGVSYLNGSPYEFKSTSGLTE